MRRSFDVKPVEENLTTVKVAGHKGNIPNTEYKIPPPPKANDDKPNMCELMKSEDRIPLRKTMVRDHVFTASGLATKMGELREKQPRPLAKLHGQRGPTPEQLAKWQEDTRAYNREMSKLRKAHAIALEADNAAFRAGARDASPFDRDTDKGSAAIVKREKAAGMLAHDIAKKYGFSLSFINETLGSKKANDVKPV